MVGKKNVLLCRNLLENKKIILQSATHLKKEKIKIFKNLLAKWNN